MKNSKPIKGTITNLQVVHIRDDIDCIKVSVKVPCFCDLDSQFIIWNRNDTELNIGDRIAFYSSGLFINWYKKEREV